ncbi:2-oxo-4-hydroxy-4-carboxy-5-ureidoimidazoline decarboxylase [Streptomyces nogalater]|uniref:2-oxo-4-hydroxy-4-carboxy-5-ureidoimidazoline decarboxylase n=1 Tax=Streptomyces nogalater TaxID=38314 RepID=A0ABW0WKX5_STRNO
MTRGTTLPAHQLPYLPKPLDAFNTASADEARTLLLRCLRSPRWSDRIAAHRPYPDLDSLLAAADEATYDLSPADLSEALAGERLPELPEDTYSAAHTALGAAHAAYEARFGHTFIIYLGDIPQDEIIDHLLQAIRSRLANDPEDERVVATEQLRRLAKGRIAAYLRGARNRATRHNAPAPGR